MHYGKLLNELAKAKGLTVGDIAAKSGRSPNTVAAVLGGSNRVNLQSIEDVAIILDASVIDIQIQSNEAIAVGE